MEVVADVLSTQSILISNPNAEHGDLVELIKRRIEGYITAQKYLMIVYNVSSDLLEQASCNAFSVSVGQGASSSPSAAGFWDCLFWVTSCCELRRRSTTCTDVLPRLARARSRGRSLLLLLLLLG